MKNQYVTNSNLIVKSCNEKYILSCNEKSQYTIGLKEYEILSFFFQKKSLDDVYRKFAQYDRNSLDTIIQYYIEKRIIVRYAIKYRWELNHVNSKNAISLCTKILLGIIIGILFTFSIIMLFLYISSINCTVAYLKKMSLWKCTNILISLLIAEILHEVGHIISARLFNCELATIGFKKSKILVNMYVSLGDVKNTTERQRIFFYLGGCVSNFIFGGMLLGTSNILSRFIKTTFLILLSEVNYILAFTNLLCVSESDGKRILQILKSGQRRESK